MALTEKNKTDIHDTLLETSAVLARMAERRGDIEKIAEVLVKKIRNL